MSDAPVIEAVALGKQFDEGASRITVFEDLSFVVLPGERIAITGKSGAGKSTLLHLLGALDRPTAGSVRIGGEETGSMNERARSEVRMRHLGFIYQFHHLLPEFSALENVSLPLLLAGRQPDEANRTALDLLTRVGLEERARHRPAELSGGERQRVAVVRALANSPGCVLADEPTGNLDAATAEQVFELLLELNRTTGAALVLVTHDEALAARLDSHYALERGGLHRLR